MNHYYKLTLFALLATVITGCKKSNDNNPGGADIYVSGTLNSKATLWKNGVPATLGDGTSTAGKIAVSGVDVYVTGGYSSSQGSQAFYFKNGAQVNVGTGQCYAIAVSGTDVYLAGTILNASGFAEAVFWKNGVINDLGAQGNAYAIAVSDGDIYVAGQTANSTGGAEATYWKNGVRTNLAPGSATCIALAGTDVYIGGWNNGASGSLGGYWKNGLFQTVSGDAGANIFDIKLSGSDVYLAGSIFDAGNTYAAYWKDGVLTQNDAFTYCYGIAISGNNLYLAGQDFIANNANPQAIFCDNNEVNNFGTDGVAFSVAVATQ